MLELPAIQERFPFSSHGTHRRADGGLLPNLHSSVVMSRWYFTHFTVPLQGQDEDAVIAQFDGLLPRSTENASLTVARVCLTCESTNDAVAAKRTQLQRLAGHLSTNFHRTSWIVASDWNLSTSVFSTNEAQKCRPPSSHPGTALTGFGRATAEASFVDVWCAARLKAADHSRATTDSSNLDVSAEGEDSAALRSLCDNLPRVNSNLSTGLLQRDHRMLIKQNGLLGVDRSETFGLLGFRASMETPAHARDIPNDHVGVFADLSVLSAESSLSQLCPFEPKMPNSRSEPDGVENVSQLASTLLEHGMFPTHEQDQARENAMTLLSHALVGSHRSDGKVDVPMLTVPVGTFALGSWDASSSLECLCIGTISFKTFLALARQRIRNLQGQGLRLAKKVEGSSDATLELSVAGIRVSLQYVCASNIVAR